MTPGEILMATGAGVWLVGEIIGLFRKQTTSHFVKLYTKTSWWHRALVLVLCEALAAHFEGLLF